MINNYFIDYLDIKEYMIASVCISQKATKRTHLLIVLPKFYVLLKPYHFLLIISQSTGYLTTSNQQKSQNNVYILNWECNLPNLYYNTLKTLTFYTPNPTRCYQTEDSHIFRMLLKSALPSFSFYYWLIAHFIIWIIRFRIEEASHLITSFI
jgi:hypothetical protein